MAVTPTFPVPVPTPYQSPMYGGNVNISPGVEGPAVPGNAQPIAGPSLDNTVSFTNGQTVSRQNVGGSPANEPTYQQGGWYNGKQYWDGQFYDTPQQDRQSGGNNSSSGSSPSPQPQMATQFGFPNMTLDQYYAEIDKGYNEQMGYLDQVEQQIRGEQPGNLKAIENDFQTVLRSLDMGKSKTEGQLKENQMTATQRKEDAQAAARRLYAELRRGYQQRFGGASSAGEAANTLAGIEQQRQMGMNQRDFGNTMRQIETQKAQVEQEYQNSLLNLQQQKQEAIRVAQSEFQQKLLEITRNRAELGANKAQQRLAALQELRNQVFAIQAQAQQFEQQLQMMKYQSDLELQNYTKQLGMAGQSGQSALNAFQPTAQSNLQVGGNKTGQNAPLYGIMYGNKDEEYTGAITPSTNMRDYLLNYGTYGYKPTVAPGSPSLYTQS